MKEILTNLADTVFGPTVIFLVLGAGIFYTIRLFFPQIRYFFFSIFIALGLRKKEEDDIDRDEKGEAIYPKSEREKYSYLKGDISYFQSLATATGTVVGLAGIIGPVVALLIGGPGVLFWMWVTAFIGMTINYVESLLSVKYREQGVRGFAGGPMFYVRKGLSWKWLSSLLAILVVVSAFIFGNLMQSSTLSTLAENSKLGIPKLYAAIGLALLTALIVIGGIKRIAIVSAIIVPIALLTIVGLSLVYLAKNGSDVIASLKLIFRYAFEPLPLLTGGFLGVVQVVLKTSVLTTVITNQIGMGSASFASAAAKTKYSVKQALSSTLVSFTNTFIIATLIILVVMVALKNGGVQYFVSFIQAQGEWSELKKNIPPLLQNVGANVEGIFYGGLLKHFGAQALSLGQELPAYIFQKEFGVWGLYAFLFSAGLLVLSTLSGWFYAGERALSFLFKKQRYPAYFMVFYLLTAIAAGLLPKQDVAWALAKLVNGLIFFPNMIAVLALSPIIFKETRDFFKKYPHKHDLLIQIYMLFISLIPKNLLSKFLGFLASLKPPRFIKIPLLLAFAKIYNINISEAELELKDYKSLNNFFTRALKNGARQVNADKNLAICPVDGTLLKAGSLGTGTFVQSKGIESTLKDLLGSKTFYDKFLGGYYFTFYLSPQDYHRIHSPVSGDIIGYYYQPGTLFPVNSIAVSTVKQLFSRNERLITYIKTAKGLVAMLKVGATTVGKVRVTYDSEISTNKWFRFAEENLYKKHIPIGKGDEIGRFEMGSTVILLFEKDTIEPFEFEEYQKFKFGEAIASYKKKVAS